MVDEIIAKSYPQKTLKEHTEEVLNNFEELKRLGVKLSINISNKDWEVLRLSCFYHDLGKANTFFQKKIGRLKNIGFVNYPEVSHNFLSLFFFRK